MAATTAPSLLPGQVIQNQSRLSAGLPRLRSTSGRIELKAEQEMQLRARWNRWELCGFIGFLHFVSIMLATAPLEGLSLKRSRKHSGNYKQAGTGGDPQDAHSDRSKLGSSYCCRLLATGACP